MKIFRWDTEYRMMKCRTTEVSKFQIYDYWNKERWVFFYEFSFHFLNEIVKFKKFVIFYLENYKVFKI